MQTPGDSAQPPDPQFEAAAAARTVCAQLKSAGYEALFAGGCVRDLLMGRRPHDFDIATSATPDQIEIIFPNSIGVGRAFGVMVVPFQGFQLEIATFRVDMEYRDGRRPEGVRFASAEEDARRRDFTCNALFLDPVDNRIIDYVSGQVDIQARLIRAVGDPAARFAEDSLRLMRAVRFRAQLDFAIEAQTLLAIRQLSHQITRISRERVRDELLKLLASPGRVAGLELLHEVGLLKALFPDLARALATPMAASDFLKRFARTPEPNTAADTALNLTMFFWPVYQPGNERALRVRLQDLKLDNATIERCLFIVRAEAQLRASPAQVRRGELLQILAHVNAPAARALARVHESLMLPAARPWAREAEFDQWIKDVVGADGQLPKPFLDGADAGNVGFAPGPAMGKWLREGYLLQLEGTLTERAAALSWLKSKLAAKD